MRIIRKLLIIRVLIFNGNLEHIFPGCDNRIRAKYTVKWGVQTVGMIFSGMMQTADTYGVDLPGGMVAVNLI